jgi:hypothetical protein
MAKKKYIALAIGLALALLLLGWNFLWSAHTPSGEPPLDYLDASNVGEFKQTFDSSLGNTRLVLLLSPT